MWPGIERAQDLHDLSGEKGQQFRILKIDECRLRVRAPDHALAASGGSANAILFPSGSGMFTWRTPFE